MRHFPRADERPLTNCPDRQLSEPDVVFTEQHYWYDGNLYPDSSSLINAGCDLRLPVPTARLTVYMHRDYIYGGWRLRARLRLPTDDTVGSDTLIAWHSKMPPEGPPTWQLVDTIENMLDEIIEFTGLDL